VREFMSSWHSRMGMDYGSTLVMATTSPRPAEVKRPQKGTDQGGIECWVDQNLVRSKWTW